MRSQVQNDEPTTVAPNAIELAKGQQLLEKLRREPWRVSVQERCEGAEAFLEMHIRDEGLDEGTAGAAKLYKGYEEALTALHNGTIAWKFDDECGDMVFGHGVCKNGDGMVVIMPDNGVDIEGITARGAKRSRAIYGLLEEVDPVFATARFFADSGVNFPGSEKYRSRAKGR